MMKERLEASALFSFFVTENGPLGCDHIEVYVIRYSLYDLLSATDDSRRDLVPSLLHHINVVCGGEQIV